MEGTGKLLICKYLDIQITPASTSEIDREGALQNVGGRRVYGTRIGVQTFTVNTYDARKKSTYGRAMAI